MCVITCRMLFSLSCLLWTLSPLKHLFSNFPSLCILSILHPFVFFPAIFSLQSLISCLQQSPAQKHLYGPVCVCVWEGYVWCILVERCVERCFSAFYFPTVCFFQFIFLSFIYFLMPPPHSPVCLSLCFSCLSRSPSSFSPLSGLQFYNLLKICVSSPAPCFLLHIQVCVCSSVWIVCVSLSLVSSALSPIEVCFCSVHWCWHESIKPTSSSSSFSVIFFFYFISFFLTNQKANTIKPPSPVY